MPKQLVIVGGPTASGKTEFAIGLAKFFKTVIVSADSRQFYKELSIGTAKPSDLELSQVPHHFINSHSVADHFSAGMFAEQALQLLENLFQMHDVVIIAGGSGLYIDALINGIDNLPQGNEEIRNELNRLFHEEGIAKLRTILMEKDPDSFHKIDTMNPRRIIRALEVSISSGVPYSSLIGKKDKKLQWDCILTGIEWPREELYDRINKRTSEMIRNGLREEAMSVINFRNQNALKTVGYKEMFEHLDGNLDLEETELLIAKNTRNYAKRQMTWFRRYPEMIWIKPEDKNELIKVIESKLPV